MNHPPDQAGYCPECGVNLDFEKCHCFDDLTPIPGTDTLVPEGDHGIVLEHPLKKHFPVSEEVPEEGNGPEWIRAVSVAA